MKHTMVSDFKYALLKVKETSEALVQHLTQSRTLQEAVCFTLPVVHEAEARTRAQLLKQHRYDQSPADTAQLDAPFAITAHQGRTALHNATRHYLTLHAGRPDSTRFSQRLPGLIQLHSNDPAQLIAAVENANTARSHLKQVIRHLSPNVETRFDLVHRAEPGFMHPMATRPIHLFAQREIKSARFNWEHKPNVSVLTRNEAIDRVRRSAAYATQDAPAHADLNVQGEIQQLTGYPDTMRFKVIRPTPVVPIVKLRFNEPLCQRSARSTETTVRQSFVAHSPMLLLNCSTPKLKWLTDYPGRTAPVTDKPCVIARLHLYEGT
ncbi:DNA replication terminus site-binding protein [Pseudoalteromonas rubra]|uniref:DNA replication terminus site-binding protein n=1 Tax=Pseudoalteromonas rubra TaxID=43658 RepID=A0A0U3I826_9GAMM|nr:DNA replication terminus site-binding protein [Pseudoalteromonas rubra]ALU46134.1 hypothetical protein AT705_24540 [Pseudoalteromonas rubra]